MSKGSPRKINGLQACVLCGVVPTTKEHAWPSYIRKTVRQLTTKTGSYGVLSRENNDGLISRYRKLNDDAESLTFRVLCANCNNNYSGDIQDQAKSALLSAFHGRPIKKSDFDFLYEWMALFGVRSAFETNQGAMLEQAFCYQYRNGDHRDKIHTFVGWVQDILPELSYLRSFNIAYGQDPTTRKIFDSLGYLYFEQTTRIRVGNFVGYVVIEHNRTGVENHKEDFQFKGRKIASDAGLIPLTRSTPVFWPTISGAAFESLSSRMLPPDQQFRSLLFQRGNPYLQ